MDASPSRYERSNLARTIRQPSPSRRADTPLGRHRRFFALQRQIARDLNITQPSVAERELLRQAALLGQQAEQLQAAIIAGASVDHETLVKLTSEQRRVLTVLRAHAPPKRAGPTLGDLLREGQDDRQSAE
jgi:hypothetical protein